MDKQDCDSAARPIEPAATSSSPIVWLIATLSGAMLVVALVIVRAIASL